jgi:hypothetical protein
MHSHPDAEGQGGLALGDVAVADVARVVGRDPEGGVEPVKGLLGGPLVGWVGVVVDPVSVVQVVGPGTDAGTETSLATSWSVLITRLLPILLLG